MAAPPSIDIAPLLNGADTAGRAATVAEIGLACKEWGFFAVLNHGVADEVVDKFKEEMRRFFYLPLEEKLKVKRTATNSRGFADDELTKQRRDWKELFDCGHVPRPELPADDPLNVVLDGYNQWPGAALPSFEPAARRYYDACADLSAVLMGAIAESLGLEQEFFEANMTPHTSYLRLNYYPPCPDPEPGQLGISRHTDAGALTVLLQDEVAALEVYSGSKEDNNDGEWVGVPPVEGGFTINIGDMLQVWTNGEYAAPEHRVRANRRLERFSAPFFYNPAYHADVQPVVSSETKQDEVKLRYRPINWGKYRGARFEGDFADVGKEVQIEDFAMN
jgi:isopenicillin N synthase-like dioxygenase